MNQARSATGLDSRSHWQDVHTKHEPDKVSWYELAPETSLAWIENTGLSPDAAILDAGGGTSALARRTGAAWLYRRHGCRYIRYRHRAIKGPARRPGGKDLLGRGRFERRRSWAPLMTSGTTWAVLPLAHGRRRRTRSLPLGSTSGDSTGWPLDYRHLRPRRPDQLQQSSCSPLLGSMSFWLCSLVSSSCSIPSYSIMKTPSGRAQQFLFAHFVRDANEGELARPWR